MFYLKCTTRFLLKISRNLTRNKFQSFCQSLSRTSLRSVRISCCKSYKSRTINQSLMLWGQRILTLMVTSQARILKFQVQLMMIKIRTYPKKLKGLKATALSWSMLIKFQITQEQLVTQICLVWRASKKFSRCTGKFLVLLKRPTLEVEVLNLQLHKILNK